MKFLPKLLVAAFLLASVSLTAQNYQSAVGARLGVPLSASYKMFINESDAVEAYAGFRSWSNYSYVNVGAAYQRHNSFDLDGDMAPLQWYFGAGAAINFWSYDFGPLVPTEEYSNISLGIQGYLGLQYAFDSVPVELTVDWVPTIYIGNGYTSGFGAGGGALGVRYILNR